MGIPAQDTVVDISGKADKTYVDNKVKTDVPLNAKFTDTVYSHPSTHPANMITGLPTSLPASGGNADTVGGFTVGVSVPANAKFTDTVYSHPATHSADMITDGTTNKAYTAAEKTKLSGIATNANNYSHPTGDGSKHVPANGTTNNGKVLKAGATAGTYIWSNDNDTITTINGKTGAITKADIVALGIPAQDTVYTHPPGTNPHGTTKSDVGLGNVTNDKQMPISGGVLENYREKLVTLSGTSTAINLSLRNVFTHTLTGNTTYSITNAVNSQAHSFTLIITQTSTVRTLTFPASVKWQGGEIPDLSTANKTYILTFMTIDGGTTWLGMFGGEF